MGAEQPELAPRGGYTLPVMDRLQINPGPEFSAVLNGLKNLRRQRTSFGPSTQPAPVGNIYTRFDAHVDHVQNEGREQLPAAALHQPVPHVVEGLLPHEK